MDTDHRARPTVAEIDRGALTHNFGELARLAGPVVGVLPVVKADAYGHGAALVARALSDAGAERFGVATVTEGELLRTSGIRGAIVVLGGIYPGEVARVVDASLTPVVWEHTTAAALGRAARGAGRSISVHVKVDTGMSRLGVAPADARELLATLAQTDGIAVEGLLTHFCNAESLEGVETTRQLVRFAALVRELEDVRLRPPLVHAANSAAILTTPAAFFDMVRPGLALYGVYPAAALAERARLQPVMRFVTRIVAVRTVAAGTGVSYGPDFIAERATRVATLPVGYADGYPRALSSSGVVVVRGVRAPIIGRVCMDQTMIDVSALEGAAVGDEVVLWGGPLPVAEVAARAGTITYELLARVGARVPRIAL